MTINELRITYSKLRATEKEMEELQNLIKIFREKIEEANKLLDEAEAINKELKENA